MVGVDGGPFPLEGSEEVGKVALIDATDGGKFVSFLCSEFGCLETGTGFLEGGEGGGGVAGAVYFSGTFVVGVGGLYISIVHPGLDPSAGSC